MTDRHTSPRITIVVHPDQRRSLEAFADRYGTTISDVIRRAIDEYLARFR